MNNVIQVKPVLRYYSPKYPTYSDPNPLENPKTIPYPFRTRFAEIASFMGISGALLAFPHYIYCQNTNSKPSLLSHSPVPYVPAMFGTGLPSRISYEEARQTIIESFESEGICLALDKRYQNDDIIYNITGYNDSLNLGFVLVDYEDMAYDLIKENRKSSRRIFQTSDIDKIVRKDFEKYSDYSMLFFADLMRYEPRIPIIKDFRIKLEERSHDYESFKEIWLRIIVEKNLNIQFRAPSKAHEQAGRHVIMRLGYSNRGIAALKNLKASYQGNNDEALNRSIDIAYKDIVNTNNPDLIKKKVNSLKKINSLASELLWHDNSKHISHLLHEGYRARLEKRNQLISQIELEYDRITVDLEEIHYLDSMALKKGIATILMKDMRMAFYDKSPSEDVLQKLDKIYEKLHSLEISTAELDSSSTLTTLMIDLANKDAKRNIFNSLFSVREYYKILDVYDKHLQKNLSPQLLESQRNHRRQIESKISELGQSVLDEPKIETIKRLEKEVKEFIQWYKSENGY